MYRITNFLNDIINMQTQSEIRAHSHSIFHVENAGMTGHLFNEEGFSMLRKKLISLVLAAVMCLSVTACSSSGSKPADAQAEGNASRNQELSMEELAEICKDPAKAFPNPVTLKIGFGNNTYQGEETLEKNAWNDLYQSVGLNVEPLYQSSEDYTAKLKEMVMTGEYPDIFYVDLNTYVDFIGQGLIADITEYYDNGFLSDYAMQYLSSDDMATVKKGYIDGKIYGIPQMSDTENSAPLLWIRKDWLDNLGLSAPTTMEEFQEVARAFTFDDPDGNGINDTYGFSMRGKDVSTGMGSSGVALNFNMVGQYPTGLRFIVEDDQIQWAGQNSEKMIYGLEIFQNMYEEGTLDPNFVSTDDAALNDAFVSGQVGMFMGSPWSVVGSYGDAILLNPDFECEALPCPSSAVNPEGGVYLPSSSLVYWCVSSKCQNPEALFKVYNMAMNYVAYANDLTKEEAFKYNIGVNGQYTGKGASIIGAIDMAHYNYTCWQNEHSLLTEGGEASELPWTEQQQFEYMKFFAENRNNTTELSEEELNKWKTGATYYCIFGNDNTGYGGADKIMARKNYNEAYNAIPGPEMTANLANLETLTAQTLIGIITGQAEPNSYNAFLEEWKAKGGQDILETVTQWYAGQK